MDNNGKKLLDKMSDIDPKLIADADKKPRNARNLLIGLTSGMATIAAAAVITFAAVNNPVQNPPIVDSSDLSSISSTNSTSSTNSGSGTSSTQDPPVIDDTPKDPPTLDFSKYKHLPLITNVNVGTTGSGGLGEEFKTVYRAMVTYAELESSSPWNGEEFETMPVYMSSSTDADLDQMCAYIKSAAAALGISESELEFDYCDFPVDGSFASYRKILEEHNLSEEEIEQELARIRRISMGNAYIEAKAGGVLFSLTTSFDLRIEFDEPIYELPENASAEDKAKAAEYLAEKYKDLLGYVNPTVTSENDIYDADGDLKQQILNYWLNHTDFWGNSGKINRIRINSYAGCDKLDDYPILTPDQAVQILQSNKYDDKNRMPINAKILKADLVYTNLMGSTAVLPYYKFYVDTGEKPSTEGYDVICDVYTIVAVPEEFIDMETACFGAYA